MSTEPQPRGEDTLEELFENAPCGYLSTRPDGTIIRVNRTFELWTSLARENLIGRVRLRDLLSPGARIYHETHYAPLLQMQGTVREIAVDFVRADGSLLPALINSVMEHDNDGRPQLVRTTIFDASDRRRYEQELLSATARDQAIARELQRSLLAGALPQSPELTIEVLYMPSEQELEVGGDWYDAFWLREPAVVGFVIGDVVGRGLSAATAMGQLRSAVRALASTGLSPAELLSAMDRYCERYDVGEMATLIYCQLTPGTGELRYACAGHPPPLLLSGNGEPVFAWDGRSAPLNAQAQDTPRPEGRCTLGQGGAVLLYTDGLTEDRTQPRESDGLERLRQEVMRNSGVPSGQLMQVLVQALRDPSRPDDVCLVAVELHGG